MFILAAVAVEIRTTQYAPVYNAIKTKEVKTGRTLSNASTIRWEHNYLKITLKH